MTTKPKTSAKRLILLGLGIPAGLIAILGVLSIGLRMKEKRDIAETFSEWAFVQDGGSMRGTFESKNAGLKFRTDGDEAFVAARRGDPTIRSLDGALQQEVTCMIIGESWKKHPKEKWLELLVESLRGTWQNAGQPAKVAYLKNLAGIPFARVEFGPSPGVRKDHFAAMDFIFVGDTAAVISVSASRSVLDDPAAQRHFFVNRLEPKQ